MDVGVGGGFGGEGREVRGIGVDLGRCWHAF
jgi:hypothetical protein